MSAAESEAKRYYCCITINQLTISKICHYVRNGSISNVRFRFRIRVILCPLPCLSLLQNPPVALNMYNVIGIRVNFCAAVYQQLWKK